MLRSLQRSVRRLAAMDAGEIRDRVAAEARTLAGRVKVAVAEPAWKRSDLRSAFPADSRDLPRAIAEARRALGNDDWHTAHRALAAHIASGGRPFLLDPCRLHSLTQEIRRRFPRAARNATARAERIREGRYDLLGYRDVSAGRPPSWHEDPVHGRYAPIAYWSSVRYLDPAYGDHKIIWELNRHQHWLALARAFHLTGERRYYVEFVAQLESWLAANPPLIGVNWTSMLELAFRSLSWLWSLHFFARAVEEDPPDATPWTVDLLLGLDRQLTHIEQNLSRHFSPNTHLTGEALALYVCGRALPELGASRRRADVGRAVLLEEAHRQVLPDGGHAELSPHYHRYSTDFYVLALGVARASADPAAPAFERTARLQAEYLRTIADDRGHLPLIGDDDGGQLFPICAPKPFDCADTLAAAAVLLDMPALAVGDPPETTFWMCASCDGLDRFTPGRGRWRSRALADSGYYVSRSARGDHLVFDAGRHGFLNGGHAHADALSLTVVARGRPLVVDPGTATYTMDASLRDRFRSSAMHNTVVAGGRSQSIPLGPFHWRSTVDARATVWRTAVKADYAEGVHDGYAPVVHARSVLAVHGLGWVVIDHLLRSHEIDAEALWHLHPDWRPQPAPPTIVRATHVDGSRAAFSSSLPLELADDAALAAFAPVYGRVVEATCLRARFPSRGPASAVTVILTGDAAADPPVVERVPVTASPGENWHAAAFRLRMNGEDGILLAAVERDGVAASADAAPGRPWGTAWAASDARVALFLRHGRLTETVLVNGARFDMHGHEIEFPARQGLIRRTIVTPLALPVHAPAPVHAEMH